MSLSLEQACAPTILSLLGPRDSVDQVAAAD